jgi:hypothetical protein
MAATAKKTSRLKKLLSELPDFCAPSVSFEAGADDITAVPDRLGRLARIRSVIEIYEKKLRAAIVENGEFAVEGRDFRATLIDTQRTLLDTAAIRAELGDEWCQRYDRVSEYQQVRVAARTGERLNEPLAAD